jgi:hypothetical protein
MIIHIDMKQGTLELNNEKELRLEPSFITTEEYLQWGAAMIGYDGNNRNTEPTTINGVKRQSKLDVDLLYWRVKYVC